MDSSHLLPLELLFTWQLGPQEPQRDFGQLPVVVPEENLLSVGLDLLVELDQSFPLSGWQINRLNLSFRTCVKRLPLPFQVHEQLAMRAVIFGEDLVPGVLCNQLVEVMAAGEVQNLPSG